MQSQLASRGCNSAPIAASRRQTATGPPRFSNTVLKQNFVAAQSAVLGHLGRQLSVITEAQKGDSSATSTRTRRHGAGKEPVPQVPSSQDDLCMVPCAYLYLEQLERHDIYTVSDMRRAYAKEGQHFRRFMQERIGVRDDRHVKAMEDFLGLLATVASEAASAPATAAAEVAAPAAAVARSDAAAAAAPSPSMGMTCDQVTLSVEGNISAGKSTFLSILNRHLLQDKGFNFVKEPIEQWQAVGGSSVNLLELFYKDPARMAYTFQNFVFLTRVLQERDSYGGTAKARILERSVFSDRMVFVRAVHASRDLADHELAIYDAWFGPILSSLPTLVPNGLIYLRASPATCMARLRKRARSEEGGIPLDYLQCLHDNHEDWLLQAATPAVQLQERLAQLRQQEQQQEEAGEGEGEDGTAAASSSTSISDGSDPATCAAIRSGGEASTSSTSSGESGPMAQRGHQRQPPAGQHAWQPAAVAAAAAGGRGVLLPLAEAPPPALAEVEVPASIAPYLYIIDATKLSGVPSAGFLHALPSLVLDCESDVDVEADMAHGEAVSSLIRDYSAFVSRYRAACHRLAAAGHPAAAGLRLPAPATEYYTTDPAGRVTYRPPQPSGAPGAGLGAAVLQPPSSPAPGQ